MRISLAFLVSAVVSLAQSPYLETLTPSAVAAGGPSFQLTASGTAFETGAIVQWNGSALPSIVVNSGQLTATVSATLIATPGTITINVLSNGYQSNPLQLSITTGTPPPVISYLSPVSATAGGTQFTLDVSGSGFVSSSMVQWNGGALATSYVSATALTAVVPASLIASVGNANITVSNPGGSPSAATIFPISACGYGTVILNQPFPASVAAGVPAFTLTVTTSVSNFFPSAVVEWNGSPLATIYHNGSTLFASVPASLIATPGVANITVFSSSPCETSTTVTLAIIAATTISSVSPSSATAGGPAFTLTVNGTGFVSGSDVLWNGSALATTYVSATQLTALVPASLIASPGSANLSVQVLGGAAFGALPFTIAGPNPVISTLGTPLTTSSIGKVPAGAPGFTLTVNGSGFLAGDSILWNGSALSTTYVNPTQLTAPVSASLIAGAGDIAITVQSPSGTSNSEVLVLLPTISSLSPASVPVGGPAFTLTVNGIGFQPGAIVVWQAALASFNLPATIVSSTQLTVSLSASLIAAPGAVTVLVQNPDTYNTSSLGFTVTGTLAPVISSGTGVLVVAGGPAFMLPLSGSNFVSGDTVLWNGSALPTTYGSATYLTAAVPASLIVSPGSVSIVVQDPSGRNSNTSTLTIEPPSILYLTPTSVFAGSPALSLQVSGTSQDFFPGTAVQWNGSPLTTTYQNSSIVTATVPASLLVRPGTANVTVVNPGGTTSAVAVFTISSPSVTSLNPSSATAGGPAFTLTIGGVGFVSGSTVQWNGTPLASSYANFSFTASVPANLIASPGTANITVLQPGGFVTNAAIFTTNAPTPVISSLNPASATAGSVGVTLVVSGSGFLPGSTVAWNGATLSTVYVSGSALNATVPATLLVSPGTANLTVVNPGGTSSPAFAFIIAPPTPSIFSSSPTSATAGGPAFTLTVNGSGFVAGSTVQWNGSALATSYVAPTQLTAVVPSSAIALQGSVEFEVVNPSGLVSGFSTFTINSAVPVISSLNPPSATVNGPQFTLTIFGSGFLPASALQWNGSAIPTSYVNGSTLTAVVSAGLISSSGSASLTVVNPGGATSRASLFTISPQVPIISSLIPNSATAGGPAFTLIVNGSGFLPDSVFYWEGSSVASTYVSGSQLTIAMPASFIAQAGLMEVKVVSAGLQSNNATFIVNSPGSGGPTITTAASLPAGAVGVPYAQTVTGSGGVTPYKNWAVADPNDLPPGISLNVTAGSQTAQLSGTPTTAGTFTFTIQLTDGASASTAKSFTLTIAGNGISISAAGIVNAASYEGGGVSAGEIVTIFGSGFGPATLAGLQLDSQGYVSSSLGNTQVMFDGAAAPMIYAVAGQVSVVVPYEVNGKLTTQVQILYDSQLSNTVAMPISATVPGIFTANASGTGQGAIINQDDTVNTTANPAPRGSYIAVYATGEGQTSPGGIDGKPGESPAPQPITQPVTATIGGLSAPVTYAGGVPGFVAGFLQVNIQIPPGVSTGSSVPIVINIGGQNSQVNVTLAVR